jgi:predicted  nucleic acid-binding Zn-ribbon protein
MRAELEAAMKALADAQAELERERQEHAARLAEAETAAESARQAAEALRAELEAERRAWEDAALQAAAEIDALRQRVGSLERELADSENSLQEKDLLVSSLHSALADALHQIQQLKNQVDDYNQFNSVSKQELLALQEAMQAAQEASEDLRLAESARFSDEIAQLRAELERLRAEVDAERLASSEREADLLRKIRALEEELAAVKIDRNTLGDEIDRLIAERDRLQRDFAALQQELADLNALRTQLEDSLASAMNEIENLRSELNQAGADLAAARAELDALNAAYSRKSAELDAAIEQLNAVVRDAADLALERDQLLAELEARDAIVRTDVGLQIGCTSWSDAALQSDIEDIGAIQLADIDVDASESLVASLEWPGEVDNDSPGEGFVLRRKAQTAFAAECRAEGSGLVESKAFSPSFFVIQACDEEGKHLLHGGDLFVVAVEGVSASVLGEVKDNQDGTYSVQYVVPHAGAYNVRVLLKQLHIISSSSDETNQVHAQSDPIDIAASPFALHAHAGDPSPPKCAAGGSGLQRAVVRAEATFTIWARDAAGTLVNTSNVRATFFETASGDSTAQPVRIVQQAEGVYECTYTPAAVGEHQVHIMVDDASIPSSPFCVDVVPRPASAQQSSASGDGLHTAVSGCTATFRVFTKDELGFDVRWASDEVAVTIRNASQATEAAVRSTQDGGVAVAYQLATANMRSMSN